MIGLYLGYIRDIFGLYDLSSEKCFVTCLSISPDHCEMSSVWRTEPNTVLLKTLFWITSRSATAKYMPQIVPRAKASNRENLVFLNVFIIFFFLFFFILVKTLFAKAPRATTTVAATGTEVVLKLVSSLESLGWTALARNNARLQMLWLRVGRFAQALENSTFCGRRKFHAQQNHRTIDPWGAKLKYSFWALFLLETLR